MGVSVAEISLGAEDIQLQMLRECNRGHLVGRDKSRGEIDLVLSQAVPLHHRLDAKDISLLNPCASERDIMRTVFLVGHKDRGLMTVPEGELRHREPEHTGRQVVRMSGIHSEPSLQDNDIGILIGLELDIGGCYAEVIGYASNHSLRFYKVVIAVVSLRFMLRSVPPASTSSRSVGFEIPLFSVMLQSWIHILEPRILRAITQALKLGMASGMLVG